MYLNKLIIHNGNKQPTYTIFKGDITMQKLSTIILGKLKYNPKDSTN